MHVSTAGGGRPEFEILSAREQAVRVRAALRVAGAALAGARRVRGARAREHTGLLDRPLAIEVALLHSRLARVAPQGARDADSAAHLRRELAGVGAGCRRPPGPRLRACLDVGCIGALGRTRRAGDAAHTGVVPRQPGGIAGLRLVADTANAARRTRALRRRGGGAAPAQDRRPE